MKPSILIKRTNSADPDFNQLVMQLDKHLWEMFGNGMKYFQQFNLVGDSEAVVLAYDGDLPVGGGCLRQFDADTVEVKRMFVVPGMRGRGIATSVLSELESWARELNYRRIILETAVTLTEAVNLYRKHNYEVIENWGQYAGIDTSVCMRKTLTDGGIHV